MRKKKRFIGPIPILILIILVVILIQKKEIINYIADSGINTNSSPVVKSFEGYGLELEKAMQVLEPSVSLIIINFNEKDYDLNNIKLEGIKTIQTSSTSIYGLSNTVTTIEYTQGFRIQQALKNDLAYSKLTQQDKEVISKANLILDNIIKDTMTEYEKEVAIHDYIVLNSKYDSENYLKGSIPDDSYTAYGILIKGIGVCQAYSEATKLLLNMTGIECDIVTGTAKGILHSWNIVKLEDQYYMLDVTWDDPVPDKQGEVRYDYFNLTSDKMAVDHIWDTDQWPQATETKYNYYNYNNRVVSHYSDFKKMIISEINKGEKEINIYINGYNANEYKLDFIFDYYSGSIEHSIPQTNNTAFKIILK